MSEHRSGLGFLRAHEAEKTDYQILLTRYALERLLYRLSVSTYRDDFILKGALLFVTWLHDPFRPTQDLDLLGYGANDGEKITDSFQAICSTPVPIDGVTFDAERLTAAPIREENLRSLLHLVFQHDVGGRSRTLIRLILCGSVPDVGRYRALRQVQAGVIQIQAEAGFLGSGISSASTCLCLMESAIDGRNK